MNQIMPDQCLREATKLDLWQNPPETSTTFAIRRLSTRRMLSLSCGTDSVDDSLSVRCNPKSPALLPLNDDQYFLCSSPPIGKAVKKKILLLGCHNSDLM